MEFSMSSTTTAPILEVIDWLIRLRDGATADWEAFTLWLEADPAHGETYDAVALADRDLDIAPAPITAANDDAADTPRTWGSHISGLAALAAALVAAISTFSTASSPAPNAIRWRPARANTGRLRWATARALRSTATPA